MQQTKTSLIWRYSPLNPPRSCHGLVFTSASSRTKCILVEQTLPSFVLFFYRMVGLFLDCPEKQLATGQIFIGFLE
jgi:hypothetical protein